MNYGQLKNLFMATLARRDVTADQIAGWIDASITRAQRLLKVPASENIVDYSVDEHFTTLPIPGDYLSLIGIFVNGIELTRGPATQVHMMEKFHSFAPRYFVREGGDILIAPLPEPGSVIRLYYLANFAGLSADTDSNWLTAAASDVLVAGAMAYACEFLLDERSQIYEGRFIQGISDLNLQAANDELTNAAIGPPCGWDF